MQFFGGSEISPSPPVPTTTGNNSYMIPEDGNLGVPQLPGQRCSFHSFRTNTYKLSFMETPSGIQFILVTNPRSADLRETLKYIYYLYVEYVAKTHCISLELQSALMTRLSSSLFSTVSVL
ncbi:hypothetical protein CRYUN_Cryun19dG0084800 [Craigia yunnanensis]